MLDKAVGLIRQLETDLRGLLAEAAAAGDYDSVLAITTIAQAVSSWREWFADGEPTSAGSGAVQPGADIRNRSRKTGAKTYPRFRRRNEDLIKIGWSKKGKREYSHRCPRTAITQVALAATGAGARKKIFSAEEIFPVRDTTGTEIPDYQAYVALAWLRDIGALTKHGRQGYSFARAADLTIAIEASWARLPSE